MSSSSSPATRRGEQAREQLIQVAIALFGESGQHATTREIAAGAGQNIAAITYYFGSKEALYLAAAQWIADLISHQHTPLLEKAGQILNHPETPRGEIRAAILDICGQLAQAMTDDQTMAVSKFIYREQLSPGSAYSLLHRQVFVPLHSRLTALFARYCGLPESDTTTLLHVHALLGEILAFRIGRETLLQRTGWNGFDAESTRVIQSVITAHITLILDGLSAEPGTARYE